MADTSRYAIYYAPGHLGDYERFGAHLLGYDVYDGKDLPFADGIEQAATDWRDLTHDPRKYGFQAQRKSPLITPVVRALGDFIAIVPAERSAELEQFAADCVGTFDSFRAPLTPKDRARRDPDRLTQRQRDYLDRWGYPYVMEELRFHMTLTGRLAAERRETVLAMLQQRFAALNLTSLAIDRLVLFRQADANSRFKVLGQYTLTAERN
jgi:hypothetical protein